MRDTRETYYTQDSGMTDKNTSPRFKVGDELLISHNGKLIPQTVRAIYWDKEFGGWLVCCHLVGVHEQNYIYKEERKNWIPHEDGLWSWWQKKDNS